MNEVNMTRQEASKLIGDLKSKIGEVIFGQEGLITEVLCCLLAGGHIIMTGAPGLAKTTLVRVIANNLGLIFKRVQFTPDLLPSDILGTEILNFDEEKNKRVFEFAKGPIFTNLLLADEINRASPKTQSALLEAMQERTVTTAGNSHRLPYPFMVFATQNPFESEGTFPLPEAQLDRFLIHSLVDYPDENAEKSILRAHSENKLFGETQNSKEENPLFDLSTIHALLKLASEIQVPEAIIGAVSQIARSTRPEDPLCPPSLKEAFLYGAGPRAGIYLISVARSLALIEGEESVRWSHILRLTKPVFRHRVRLTLASVHDGFQIDEVMDQILRDIESANDSLVKNVVS